jgi:tetratricopeptide (TPR) repeat protein
LEGLIQAVESKTGLRRPAPSATVAASTEAVVAVSSTALAQSAASTGTVASGAVSVSSAEAVAVVPAAPAVSPEEAAAAKTKQLVDGYMALMEVAFRQSDLDKVIQLAHQVIEVDNTSVLAYKRLGAAYHAQKRYPEALSALESAFNNEKDSEARRTLRTYINALAAFIKKSSSVAAKPARPVKRVVSLAPRDIERLYEAGVEYYSRGQLSEAAAAFREVLGADANNQSARRALRRVEAEMIQSGDKR